MTFVNICTICNNKLAVIEDKYCQFCVPIALEIKNGLKRYYYYHPESDALWWSYNDPEKTGNEDGCIQQLDKEDAERVMKELDLNEIPYVDI